MDWEVWAAKRDAIIRRNTDPYNMYDDVQTYLFLWIIDMTTEEEKMDVRHAAQVEEDTEQDGLIGVDHACMDIEELSGEM